MAALGEVATEQRPVLVDLNASAGELKRFFDDTAELSTASRPAIRALGDAAVPGRQAVRAARPHVRELRRFARRTPDLGRNLRILLEDFDDPARAVERDPRSPGGRGFSGTQALLRYVFSQSLTINAFDELGYMVRAAVHTDKCSPYADAKRAKDPDQAECRAWLGPEPARRDRPRTPAALPGPPRPPPSASARPAAAAATASGRTPAPQPPGAAPGSRPAARRRRRQPPGGLDAAARRPAPEGARQGRCRTTPPCDRSSTTSSAP